MVSSWVFRTFSHLKLGPKVRTKNQLNVQYLLVLWTFFFTQHFLKPPQVTFSDTQFLCIFALFMWSVGTCNLDWDKCDFTLQKQTGPWCSWVWTKIPSFVMHQKHLLFFLPPVCGWVSVRLSAGSQPRGASSGVHSVLSGPGWPAHPLLHGSKHTVKYVSNQSDTKRTEGQSKLYRNLTPVLLLTLVFRPASPTPAIICWTDI